MTYHWKNKANQIVLDSKDKVVNQCYNFINQAHTDNTGVLVHSAKGQSRACVVILLWMMRRYKWTLKKTLEFLESRLSNLKIRRSFIKQLNEYEQRLKKKVAEPMSSKWSEVIEKTNDFENEELLLRNTYLNAQIGPVVNFSDIEDNEQPPKIKWVDFTKKKAPLSTVIGIDKPAKKRANKSVPIIKGKKHIKNSLSERVMRNKKAVQVKADFNKYNEEKKLLNRRPISLNKESQRVLNGQRVFKDNNFFCETPEPPCQSLKNKMKHLECSIDKTTKEQNVKFVTRHVKSKTDVNLNEDKLSTELNKIR